MDWEYKKQNEMIDLEEYPTEWNDKIISMIDYSYVFSKICNINDKLMKESNRKKRMENASMTF